MKKRLLPLFLSGLLLSGMMLVSCSKEKNLLLPAGLSNGKVLISGIVKNVNLSPIEQLGKGIYFDKISVPNSMACADCHAPRSGFTGPMVGINIHGAVYRGADAQNFGDRKPPSAAYATFSPVLHYDMAEELFIGGNFWNGRATGKHYEGNPDLGPYSPTAAEQALGPFTNPAEHNVPDMKTVLEKISTAKYISLWEKVWGESLTFDSPGEVVKNYDRVGIAIAAYEGSPEVNQFTSKYDYFLKGMLELTDQEAFGLELFNGKGLCSACHISESEDMKPLFTDFTFDNLGTPKNPENPIYNQDPAYIDEGLGGFLKGVPEWADLADANMGKHKVPTLRNVDKKPGSGFTKAYLHNGVFKSLKEVVHFYNTRDVEGMNWPAPEVAENVNDDELGNLGLTNEEEDAIVAFMQTLSDGYVIK
jgi:cytochrome c peroxidase